MNNKLDNIKKMITTLDYEVIDEGIKLIFEENSIEVYEELLVGCKVEDGEYSSPIIPNNFFNGNEENQHYLNYAMLNIIANCPDTANVDSSIKKENFIKLELQDIYDDNYQPYPKLKKFPLGICKLKNLVKINFFGCKDLVIPKEIGNLNKLEEFNLVGCGIEELPDEIGMLISLRELYLGANNLKVLPETIKSLNTLKSAGGLWINENADLSISKNIKDFVDSKIDQVDLLSVKIFEWASENDIISGDSDEYEYQECCIYSYEDLFNEEDDEYGNLFNRLLLEVVTNKSCPIFILFAFVNPVVLDQLNAMDHYISNLKKIRESVLHSQNFRDNLNHIGFGLLENPTNNNLVCKLKNGTIEFI